MIIIKVYNSKIFFWYLKSLTEKLTYKKKTVQIIELSLINRILLPPEAIASFCLLLTTAMVRTTGLYI